MDNNTLNHKQLVYVKEARRLSLQRSTPIPIYPYTEYLYEKSELFLDTVSVVNKYYPDIPKTEFNTYLFTMEFVNQTYQSYPKVLTIYKQH